MVIVEANNLKVDEAALTREPCLLALMRLEALHRTGSRLSYEQVSKIEKIARPKHTYVEPAPVTVIKQSTSADYFRRLQERMGRRRARRRLIHAWAQFCRVVRPENTPAFEQIETEFMMCWADWARRPFKVGCNKIFVELAKRLRPFPKTYSLFD